LDSFDEYFEMKKVVPKEVLLNRISSEMYSLGQQMKEIELVILQDLLPASRTTQQARRTLQQIDRSIQTLSCLADCISEIARSDPREAELSIERALGSVALDSIADRIVFGVEASTQNSSGDVEVW
jgi:hypothetical protein